MKSEYIELAAGISKVLDYRGKTPQKLGSDWVEQGVRVISAKNVHDGKLDNLDSIRCVTKEIYEKWMKEDIQRNDILLASEGASMGESMLWESDEKIVLGQRLFCLRCDSSVLNPYYLAMYMRTPEYQAELVNHATGTSVLGLRQPALLRTKVRYLPIESQNMIGNLYRVILARIDNNKKINDNLEQQAKLLYEEMFLNNPDADMVSGTLSDIATITMGQSPSGSSYNEDSVGEVFYQGRAEFGFRFPTRRLFTTEPKRMAEPGDVLLSVRAPVGDLNVAYEKCCIGRGLGAIHSKTGDSSFMLYTMFALKPHLDIFNGEGTVFGSINRDGLSNLPVNIPSAEEIAKFEAVVRPMDNLIRTNYEEICCLQSIRDSLLPKLMSGEIDVSNIQL